jgi:hypothetical protein
MIMNKTDFRKLFQRALTEAAENAEANFSRPVPPSFLIELHAPGFSERLITAEEALDQIYLGEDRFYRTIDVAIKEVRPKESVVFVRVSGHSPDVFSKTWDPSGSGPFKQISSLSIEADRS